MPLAARGPQDLATLDQVPHGKTARRLDWMLLPPMVRRLVEDRFGTTVVDAVSSGAGYTPGLASVLTGADGRRVFLKAASKKAQRPFADAYREEIHKLRSLPAGLPVPHLLWSHEDDLWVLLALEYVDGHHPARPWQRDQLDASLDTLEMIAHTLTPPPMALRSFGEDFADFLGGWDHVRATSPEWPRLEEAAELATGFAAATAGNTLVHTDVRDDNLIVGPDRVYVCDWNWPVVGAAWIDTVCLLMTAHGDGVDADAVLAERRLTRTVDPAHIDSVLALFCGYFLQRRDEPAPHSSPWLRVHQSWSAEVTWDWLARRRGWV